MNSDKTILFTRKLKKDSLVRFWAQQENFHLIEQPFIQLKLVDHANEIFVPETDWIFFSSPNGATIYIENYSLKAKKIAALGAGTADAIEAKGLSVSFCGDHSKSPAEIGKNFFAQVNPGESVYFPVSQLSRRSIIKQAGNHKVFEEVTYQNVPIESTLQTNPKVLILTSPSNIDSFLANHQIQEDQSIIVLGSTSKKHIYERLDIDPESPQYEILVPASPDEKEIVKLLSKLMN